MRHWSDALMPLLRWMRARGVHSASLTSAQCEVLCLCESWSREAGGEVLEHFLQVLSHLGMNPLRARWPAELEARHCGMQLKKLSEASVAHASAAWIGGQLFYNALLDHLLEGAIAQNVDILSTVVSTSYDETPLHLRATGGQLCESQDIA